MNSKGGDVFEERQEGQEAEVLIARDDDSPVNPAVPITEVRRGRRSK
jgi:hypothetical protein